LTSERDIWFGTRGPRTARIAIVGEAWGYEEAAAQLPFVGQSGKELERMLREAGINPDECFFTNVVSARPDGNEMWRFFLPNTRETPASPETLLRGLHPSPIVLSGLESLYAQLRAIRPSVIVALGNYALWALTSCTSFSTSAESEGRRVPSGIMQWRGSLWHADAVPSDIANLRLVPVIHPAAILRAWYNRAVTVHDLRERVSLQGLSGDWRPSPEPIVWAPPTFKQAQTKLQEWLTTCGQTPLRLMSDIETARGLITCMGFADSADFAMSIPFVKVQPGQHFESYWTRAEEFELVRLIRLLLSHPNCLVEGQNYLYDIQYIQSFLACRPSLRFDSMLAHHLLFPGTPKSLDYLSSLYCRYHWFWKEDHKEWDMHGTIERLLNYNALDCLRNFEVNEELRRLIPLMGQETQWEEELEKNDLALEMMTRGVRIDKERRATLNFELAIASDDMSRWFESVLPQRIASPDVNMQKKGARPWWQSAHQQKRFFREDLGLKLPLNRKTERETFGHEAIQQLKEKHPEFSRLFDALIDFRSIRVFHNTFVKAGLSPDGRMRCMFNTAGTETFRWSSSTNAFGEGTNLQNIPQGEED